MKPEDKVELARQILARYLPPDSGVSEQDVVTQMLELFSIDELAASDRSRDEGSQRRRTSTHKLTVIEGGRE